MSTTTYPHVIPVDLEAGERSDRDRHVEWKWALQQLDENVVEYVTLSVSHDKDRKMYRASLGQQIEEQREHGRSVMFGLFSGSNVLTRPAARFSQKQLNEFAIDALTVVIENAANDDVAKQFTPSDRSCGCVGKYHATGCPVYAAHVEKLNARGRAARGE